MTVSQWVRGLPGYVRIAVPILGVAVGAGTLTIASNNWHGPQADRRAPIPSASPAGSPTASPSESPSPTPSPSPSPSPVPSPSAVAASPTRPPAPAPRPAPATTSCDGPAGGFPGSQLAATYPVALAWSPDGRLFWAERRGVIKVYQGGAVRTFATVPTITSGERGLLGLAISGASVYAMYSSTDGSTQTIVRWTDCGGNAINYRVIAAGLPAGTDCCHKGGRLAVSPDGHLFATIGDNHAAAAAQDWGDLRGKVIRFNLDGGGRTVWTAGLRNPFGIAFSPDGTLAVTNNGPSGDAGTPCGSCGDEFDVVGKNPGVLYEWATCWGYDHPFGGAKSCNGLGPQYSTEGGGGFGPRSPFFVAPTGVTWSNGTFFFCAYSTHHLYRYNGQGSVGDTGLTGCELDVKQGPDGALYTSDEGAIYRH